MLIALLQHTVSLVHWSLSHKRCYIVYLKVFSGLEVLSQQLSCHVHQQWERNHACGKQQIKTVSEKCVCVWKNGTQRETECTHEWVSQAIVPENLTRSGHPENIYATAVGQTRRHEESGFFLLCDPGNKFDFSVHLQSMHNFVLFGCHLSFLITKPFHHAVISCSSAVAPDRRSDSSQLLGVMAAPNRRFNYRLRSCHEHNAPHLLPAYTKPPDCCLPSYIISR